MVDEYYAAQNKLHVGQTIKLLNHDCGIAHGGCLAGSSFNSPRFNV
jgi:hypothetical protein